MMSTAKENIVTISGKKSWKEVVIMCGVHGNEVHGIRAVNTILREIKIESGIVHFIYANPIAIEQNTRFIDKNMNRCFSNTTIVGHSYEETRAMEILPYLKKSDYLLDLHSSNSKDSIPFLISEHKDIGKYFPVEVAVSWFQSIEPGGSDGFIDSQGGKWFCLECWSIYDHNWTDIATKAVVNFLQYTGNIKGEPIIFNNPKYLRAEKVYITRTNKFRLYKDFVEFEEIKKWDIVWFEYKEKVIAERDFLIAFARNRDKIGDEGFIECIAYI